MTVIEKKFRLEMIAEDIEHEDSKIAVVNVETAPGPDFDHLMSASWHLQRAVQELRRVSFTSQPKDLCSLLEISIQQRNNTAG